MSTAKPTIGLFGYIFKPDGRLFVKQREKPESLPGDWDLPGGGVEEDANNEAKDERMIVSELLREIREETGFIVPHFDPMPPMHPTVLAGGKDWAFGINIGVIAGPPPRGPYRYLSPDELEELTNGSIGNRLVSGYGKRMHRLCLYGLAKYSPNENFRIQATEMLEKIWDSWS